MPGLTSAERQEQTERAIVALADALADAGLLDRDDPRIVPVRSMLALVDRGRVLDPARPVTAASPPSAYKRPEPPGWSEEERKRLVGAELNDPAYARELFRGTGVGPILTNAALDAEPGADR